MALWNLAGDTLRAHPDIALFLALAIGYAIGQIRFGPIQLGGICGTLIAALVIGQIGVTLDAGVKNVFFMLFIFALGYAGGPQFFANLNAKGLRIGLLSLIEVVAVLALVLGAVRLLHLDAGTAAGLMAGAATESAVVGTATDAISKLALPADEVHRLQANVVTAYSITYIFGLITIVVATSQVFPLLLRVNLRAEADRLWKTMGGQEDEAGRIEAASPIVGRVYQVTGGAGHTVGEIDALLRRLGGVEGVRRCGRALALAPELQLEAGDRVLLVGHRGAVLRAVEATAAMARETSGTGDFDLTLEQGEVVLTRKDLSGRTLRQLKLPGADGAAAPMPANVYVSAVLRGGQSLPLLAELEIRRGDLLRLTGRPAALAQAVHNLGERVIKSSHSNIGLASAGIVLGVWIGLYGIHLGGVPFSLGTGGGALLSGLVLGWLQARHPGRLGIPADALALLKDLGLATFIACVGLASGPQALALVQQYGFSLPLMGIVIALVPACISLVVGRWLLGFEAPVLLGAIAGQQCSTPALMAVQNAAGNTTPLLGYTITYAISNVILPLMGPAIVAFAGLTSQTT